MLMMTISPLAILNVKLFQNLPLPKAGFLCYAINLSLINTEISYFAFNFYLNNRVFLSRNYQLIVSPQKLDVGKTNIIILRTKNFQGATIRPIVPRY